MEKITVIKADYREIEALLEKHYGITHYEIVAAEEASNGSNLSYKIDGVLDKSDEKKFQELATGKFIHFITNIVLNKLCADGHIEAGDYIIEIYW